MRWNLVSTVAYGFGHRSCLQRKRMLIQHCCDFPECPAAAHLRVRDAARWNYRYGEHPEYSYRVLMVSNRWTAKPLAALVLRAHPDHLELLDFVGSRDGIPLALRAARMHAAELGLAHVKGWFSSALVDEFSQGQAALEPNDIRVPVNLWGRDADQARPIAPLWLMAGDTDFR